MIGIQKLIKPRFSNLFEAPKIKIIRETKTIIEKNRLCTVLMSLLERKNNLCIGGLDQLAKMVLDRKSKTQVDLFP